MYKKLHVMPKNLSKINKFLGHRTMRVSSSGSKRAQKSLLANFAPNCEENESFLLVGGWLECY